MQAWGGGGNSWNEKGSSVIRSVPCVLCVDSYCGFSGLVNEFYGYNIYINLVYLFFLSVLLSEKGFKVHIHILRVYRSSSKRSGFPWRVWSSFGGREMDWLTVALFVVALVTRAQ